MKSIISLIVTYVLFNSVQSLTFTTGIGEYQAEQCFKITGKPNQFLIFEYYTLGTGSKEQVMVRIRYPEHSENIVNIREIGVSRKFDINGQISLCFSSIDARAKRINFNYVIKDEDHEQDHQAIKLDHIHEAQDKLTTTLRHFEFISRNIYKKSDLDKELSEYGQQTRKTQKWLSIIKFVLVALLCAGQVYFITLFFTSGQKKRVQSRVNVSTGGKV
ncbi:UNKNOWN [Stylonychia lemnae]|uniref:GOLD domain-containing protein n=1 Tax=Stylonychia lemnae TaxID=5949 RepID=A0A078AIY5_STYLE|nr:UNKNOWN [Stylonychia lemnae]|eukprot:CDW81417.1 UNKNOWN [Stylonychia lemnae]